MTTIPDEVTLKDIHDSYMRIKPYIKSTYVDHSDDLSHITGASVYLKMEMLQRCRAFKFRGALSKISTLKKGSTIACASAGNHSQGCALSSQILGMKCIVYMPTTAPITKVKATRNYGAEVRQYGESFDEAAAKCQEDCKNNPDWIFVPPFDDKYVIAGQGTIGLEISNQVPQAKTVVVPVGGGGLCAGVCVAIKNLMNARIIAVNAAIVPASYIKFQKIKGLPIDKNAETEPNTGRKPLADGIAVKNPGKITFPYLEKYVDEFVVVTENEISCAIALLAERCKLVVEGAGASTLAAVVFKKFKYEPNENIVCLLSGGNILLERLNDCYIEAKDFLSKH